MKLRGRFTLTLALAALVPITVAAVVTTRVIAASYRQDYEDRRAGAEKTIRREIQRLTKELDNAETSLASHENPFVNGMLREIGKGMLDSNKLRDFRVQSVSIMRGLSLDILMVTSADDAVLIAPHYRALINDAPQPAVRQRAVATGGTPFFTRDKIMSTKSVDNVLVAEAVRVARDENISVSVLAGRRVSDELLSVVRDQGQIDARVVAPNGDILLAPGKDWDSFAKDPPIRAPLLGIDNTPVAYVEVAVSRRDLDTLLWNVVITAALLAACALGAVIVLGLLVARRTAHDLEALVEGSMAAARGDLDHRVPVRSTDEVGAVASSFNLMLEDLKTSKERLVIAERIAAWQEIARRLAHEIKNPLTPIQMAMDTLRKSWKKQHPEFGEILDESTTTVLEEADRLKRIVAEFSDFARMPKPEFARIDLNEVVRSALGLYQGAVPVESKLDELPEIDADKGQINQVLLNLVENGRDAIGSREGGKIRVTTRRGEANDRVQLVVEDNGPGVPLELKDKVFAPYFTTKHAKGGTGLGLAIVHRIINDHGGRITISDAPGGGARFSIELPLRNGIALMASRI